MDGNNQNGQNNGQYSNYQDYTANAPYMAPPEEGRNNETNGLQIAGLVCGILAICLSCCYGILGICLGIAGLICAILGNRQGSNGVGIAGIVCSVIGMILGVIVLLFVVWAIIGLRDGMYDLLPYQM